MTRVLRLLAAMLGLFILPALAQSPAPQTAPRTSAARPAAAPAKRVDINSASERDLDVLPGIGPVRAKAIVAGRPFADLPELVSKNILTQGVYDGIKDRVALANINTSTAADFERTLKGIGDVRAKAIVAGRPYATPQDLVTKGILTQATFDGMKDQITY
ncbi:MAG: helix-hairpin-helix domain-containing protein [Gemmatimonadaceae bacterium]|nr:helix-hairpin-helix domain-containing protein [Acetobacteraceae bacterium]